MSFIFKKKRHLYNRLPLGLLAIFIFSFSPLIIGIAGAWFIEMRTGQPCHEGNCAWGALPWLTLITMPIGFFLFVVLMIILLLDLKALNSK